MGNYFPLILLLISVFVVITSANTILLPSEHQLKLSGGCPAPDPSLNYRPVIGIVSHPGDGASGRISNATGVSYIAASNVKFVESAGARVIPLIYNEPTETLIKKLNLVNGVVFPGGSFEKGEYLEALKEILQKVLEKNDGGDNFPLLAINLGFQLLTIIVSEDNIILEKFSASNQASTLQVVEGLNVEGTLFQRFPYELLRKVGEECLVMQNHKWGISPESFQADADLSNFFNVLTTSLDKDNKVYVSTIQGKKYPVVAVQWAPERNAFEWALSEIPHSEDAILVSQSVANYFVSEARKSSNVPNEPDVRDNLIYNYNTSYSGKDGSGFVEVYIFS
ncbi:PREDICTED: gamma-glutamyl hydrolase 2-like isoform X2 [Ipomoea nil]|uniref:gamma-glutamyl hydrolase 2-like isoform X2 n=1 Tax=Ipomoea nil TaxID=35883 RepID=UPI000901105D|nr:PREDICTED: gamma-glutamyl hydrolase 2-like isoform X2 [Ipomoea nil]